MLTVLQDGLSPLRGPSASHKAEYSIDNIDARHKHQATDAWRRLMSLFSGVHLLLFPTQAEVGDPRRGQSAGMTLCKSQVGSCNCSFEACSAFTHVMACTLAESPSDRLHRRLRQLRCLRCRFDCRLERTSSRAGVTPADVQRLFTAHYFANYG
jgi:hypothetical protein